MDLAPYFSGNRLYGDDFDRKAIEQWYRDEEEAYYDLAHDIPEYEYHAFNRYYAFDKLKGKHFATCLAFGCADGEDVVPLADNVDKFIALEPAEKWWKSAIGGKPANYIKPSIDGAIPLPEGSVDIAVCLGVVHHIPNVSFVISEMHRVLAKGGILVLREPIFSMGDWSKPRPGLTRRERGIPPQILLDMLDKAGFDVTMKEPCMVPVTPKLGKVLGIEFSYNSRAMVVVDRLMSLMTRWNMRYHRRNVAQKLAPTSLYVMATKR
ncbi:class I SAM-dependent methyltransferase [uncultured Sphingomonas sp.]|uniref:class I SAM-dependent methyltransferase n=1 Tax=uncultured Sphingomonas sp. TaxID=158754 RepID=UPI0025E1C84B|nr:class I SAM-dependent methyltransferase [uncultured Sphingomonas sp.]